MLRRALALAWVLVLALVGSRHAQAQQRDAWGDEPLRGNQVQQGGGVAQTVMTVVASALGGLGLRKFVIKPLRARRRRKQLHKMLKAGVRAVEKDPDLLNIQINIAENQRLLDSTLEVAREWEKRLYALPDRNQDGRISRPEFDDYMARYRRMHPQLRDGDLPRWEEMDTDRTGYITFQEWLEYMDRIRRQRAVVDSYGY